MSVTLVSVNIETCSIGDLAYNADEREEFLSKLGHELRKSFPSAAIMIDVCSAGGVFVDTDNNDSAEIARANETVDMIVNAVIAKEMSDVD